MSLTVEGEGDELRPSDFVIRAERYGVPQARHRVILLGVRSDLQGAVPSLARLTPSPEVHVGHVLGPMPRLRSGVSRTLEMHEASLHDLRREFAAAAVADGITEDLVEVKSFAGKEVVEVAIRERGASGYAGFISDPRMSGYVQHETRGHMVSDLERYYYASAFAVANGRSPKLVDFPDRCSRIIGMPGPLAARSRTGSECS